MRAILSIAFNQIRIQLSERGVLITAFVMPVIMMFFIGTFTGQGGWQTLVIDVVRLGDPAEPFANRFVELLRADGQQEVQPGRTRFIVCDLAAQGEQPAVCAFDPASADSDLRAFSRQRVEDSIVSASIVLPETFGADLRAGTPVDVIVHTRGGNPVAGQTFSQYVDAVNARLGGAVLAARVATERANAGDAFFERVYAAAEASWATDPVQIDQQYSTVTGTEAGEGFGQSAPGIGAMFVMINALVLAQSFITERKNWTMQRLMVLPIRRAQLLAGKLLGQYLLGLLTYGLMIVAGALLGVQWGDPLGVIVIVLLYTLAVTALALALSTIIRSAGQAQGIGLLVPMVLAPLGGAWWGMDMMPATMQTIGRIVSPIAWSQQAFTQMIFYGATLPDLLPSIGMLILYTVIFFGIGLARFRFE